MDSIRQYLLSVTAAALICGTSKQLIGSRGTGAMIVRIIGGIFLTMTVISPLAQISLDGWGEYAAQLYTDGETAVKDGRILSRNALEESIITQTEAYILDKASSLDAEVSVDVQTGKGEIPVPDHVTIRGNLSPYVRRKLEKFITEELGIGEENIKWITY